MIIAKKTSIKMIKLFVLLFLLTISFCSTKKNETNSPQPNPAPAIIENSAVSTISSEDDFNKIIEEAGNNLLIFDLYADWCRPCKMLSPTLEKLAVESGKSASFYKVNVDRFPQIAQSFGVNGIPHVAFMKNKTVITTIVGLQPEEEYRKVINENISR